MMTCTKVRKVLVTISSRVFFAGAPADGATGFKGSAPSSNTGALVVPPRPVRDEGFRLWLLSLLITIQRQEVLLCCFPPFLLFSFFSPFLLFPFFSFSPFFLFFLFKSNKKRK